MRQRYAMVGGLLLVLLLVPVWAQALCCQCGGTCPQSGQCSTTGTASDACSGLCAHPDCTVASLTAGVCAYGGDAMFMNCTAIDGVPPPTATATATATATTTATSTTTATATATGSATATGMFTSTPTASPVPQGGACTDASQCGTGHCADGVCCDTVCDQPLHQCNLPGRAGMCASTAAGAPAMSPWGLLAAAGVLAGIAGLALQRRLQRS